MEFILIGEVPSKKNFWKIGRNRYGQAYIYQANKVSKWTHDNGLLLKSLYKEKPIENDVRISAEFHIKRDKDLDNMLGTLFDLIQGILIKDDKQIKEIGRCRKIKTSGECKVYFTIEKLK